MAQRYSLYSNIHKAVRYVLGELITRAGRTDYQDEDSLRLLRAHASETFAFLVSHAEHENNFIHPVLAEHRPDIHAQLGAAHDDQEERLAELRRALTEIDPRSEDAAARGHAFLLSLARLFGELLTHMSDEEEIVMPALWAALDDGALHGIHDRLVASIPPDEMMQTMAWMFLGMSHPERLETLTGIRMHAPPPVFGAMLDVARRVLDAEAFARLSEDLLPPSRRAA